MDKKLKIFLISNTSNFFNSFMLNHVEKLCKKYDLFICCNNAKILKKKFPTNVTFINVSFKRGINLLHDFISFFLVLFFFIKIRPNLSISFTPKIGFIVALVSFLTRTPYRIHWFTGQIWANYNGLKKVFYKSIDRLIFLLCHSVFVDGFSQRDFLIKEKIITKKKSLVFRKGSIGGVDVSKFRFKKQKRIQLRERHSINKNTFVFLYLGRINKDKGIIDLIHAFKRIEKNQNILLIFVGEIEDKNFVDILNSNKKILYFNFTPNPENWFSLADILCVPSYREGFGTVVIEAASCGIPSLCSNIYGLNDAIIQNKTGFFHNAGSINDIKKKMIYIIKNKKLVKKFGLSARKRVLKDFEQNLLTKELLKFINSKIF